MITPFVIFKTTNVVDIQGVSWQCSLGAYALEKQCNITVPKIYCIHLRDSKVNMFELERISNEEIEKLLDCEINNTLYNLPIPTKTDISLPDSLSTKAKRLYSAVSKINQLKERLDNEISEFMQDNNTLFFTSGGYLIYFSKTFYIRNI